MSHSLSFTPISTALPLEIIEHILEYIGEDSDENTLRACALLYVRRVHIASCCQRWLDDSPLLEDSPLPATLLNIVVSKGRLTTFELQRSGQVTIHWAKLHSLLRQAVCIVLRQKTVIDLRLGGIRNIPLGPVVLLCQGIRRLTLDYTTFVLPETTIMANVASIPLEVRDYDLADIAQQAAGSLGPVYARQRSFNED
ncbi:unnamed protein product [Cyclocybe aegerita]|uniref:F-box domain-containing protein n=1 Tax=Cyclocybe aegerita TaxID=1973307 RepID=A0A8S0WH11_CYCAE|nr:unnamed protein product [Cyclocybe aegerita]